MSYFPSQSIIDAQIDKQMLISPLRGLKTVPCQRTVGKTFSGTTKDPNFWTETVANGGGVTQAGQILLQTNTTANGQATYQTVRKARYIQGMANEVRCICRLAGGGVANNVRRFGGFTVNGASPPAPVDGCYFELNGTVLSVNVMTNGLLTQVVNGAFNGKLTPTYVLNTNIHRFTIQYTTTTMYFFIDDTLLHTMSFATDPPFQVDEFPMTLQNLNTGGSVSDVLFYVNGAAIMRLGELETEPRYARVTTGTVNLKYGAGLLHAIIISGPSAVNSFTTVYDETTGATTVISVIRPGSSASSFAPASLDFHVGFSTGLKVVVTGTVELTFVYE